MDYSFFFMNVQDGCPLTISEESGETEYPASEEHDIVEPICEVALPDWILEISTIFEEIGTPVIPFSLLM